MIAGCAVSCTSVQSQRMLLAQGRTITNIQYEEVMDNLAMARRVPGILPWHLSLTKGSVSAQNTVTPSFSTVWPTISHTLGLSATYQQQHGWDVVPFDDPIFLRAAIKLYAEHANDPWINEGKPPAGREAFTAHDGSYYIWVDAKDVSHLTSLSLALLDAEKTHGPSATPGGTAGGGKTISPKMMSKILAPSGGQQMLINPVR